MAIKIRNGEFYIYFRPFNTKQVGVKISARTKREATTLEKILVHACRTGNYSGLDELTKDACVRMFLNQKWQLPPGLCDAVNLVPPDELTFWRAAELFTNYPETRRVRSFARYESALLNLVGFFGKNRPLKEIRVPDLKDYRFYREKKKAAPATINREMSTLSKMFQVMIELERIDVNPVRAIKRLSEKSGERQVYLSLPFVREILDQCPEWYRSIVLTAYYTGMRRGEILDLTRKQISLSKRIITLAPEDTKEAHWKRIPIHRDLIPILEESLRVQCIGTEKVFLLRDEKGIRPLGLETFKNPWERACKALELDKPWPRFHDLRHTWKTNARRSGMHPEIEQAIMGHSQRKRSVHERYGRISDQELVQAIDKMTFDHGETEILISGNPVGEKCEHFVNKKSPKKKRSCGNMT